MIKRRSLVLVLSLLVLALCLVGCSNNKEGGGSTPSCATQSSTAVSGGTMSNGDTGSSGSTMSSGDTGSSGSTTASGDTGSSESTVSSSDTGSSESTVSSSDTVQSGDTVSSSDTMQGGEDKPPQDEKPAYYTATVMENSNVIAFPYTGGSTVKDELVGIYYSASTPGGEPTDKDGKIWLVLKPIEDKQVYDVTVEGEYTSLENLGRDVYCIHGVASNLTVSYNIIGSSSAQREFFDAYGHGVTEDGRMVVTWVENPSDPIRYVEISYNDGTGDYLKYIDGADGRAELFTMAEGQKYTVTMCAIGYKSKGWTVDVKGCYMPSPKDVPFPRVEITTENYIWPDCDFVASPEDCWGAGITNAFYEQCIVTLYNEQNEIVYRSSDGKDEGQELLGAKMKIRGNTSARYASSGRYPYKIKLDKKADLLAPFLDRGVKDGYKDKDWLLLNYGNDGFRISGDAIADGIGTEWSPDYCYVSLYVNGEYRGLYVLSEAVEEGGGTGDEKWRVDVEKDGYVFECDAYWWNEELSFSTPLTENTPMHFTFKYPDSDKLTPDSEEVKYLQEYLTEFEEALMKNDDSYLDYIDLDSFVKWLLVADILCINDGGGCNIFLYKRDSTENSKIAMGPNWDFDSYMGNAYGLATIRMKWNGAPFYYQYLIEKESFQNRYKELFFELCDGLDAYVEGAFELVDEDAHTRLLQYDNICFGTSTKTLSVRKDKFLNWLHTHIEWMKEQFR